MIGLHPIRNLAPSYAALYIKRSHFLQLSAFRELLATVGPVIPIRPLQVSFPLHRKLEGMRASGSLFITRGYEQDTKNERSSSATEMIVEGSTVDLLDSEKTQTVPATSKHGNAATRSFNCSRDLSASIMNDRMQIILMKWMRAGNGKQ